MGIVALLVLRIAARIAAIVLAVLHANMGLENELTVSLLVMGIFILVETAVSALLALSPGLTSSPSVTRTRRDGVAA